MNQEEINQMFDYENMEKFRNAEALRILREERDRLLKETDWITLRSYSQGVPVPEKWSLYQEALRNLPQTSTPIISSVTEETPLGISGVDWPVKPQ